MGATNEASPWDLANPQESIGQEALDILTQLNVINLENPIKGKKDFLFSIGGFMSFLTSPDDASLYFDIPLKLEWLMQMIMRFLRPWLYDVRIKYRI